MNTVVVEDLKSKSGLAEDVVGDKEDFLLKYYTDSR